MIPDSLRLIDGYLDESLSPEEQLEFEAWLKASPEAGRLFAQRALLHDQLRGAVLMRASVPAEPLPLPVAPVSTGPVALAMFRPWATLLGAALTIALVWLVLWKGLGENPASAAALELNRLISVSAKSLDRTYQVTVEEVALHQSRGKHNSRIGRERPPKPPMEGAMLYVRGVRQFVLARLTKDGEPFITGSDGKVSWAVQPQGPVHISPDTAQYSRDLPGHEYAMPLNDIQGALEQLRDAYDIQVLPIEEQLQTDFEASRLLVAIKKRGSRGPNRVEITYALSGEIRQLRFVEMPYGPDRLTLRLTLVDQSDLGEAFFDHSAHHAPDRVVELEEKN